MTFVAIGALRVKLTFSLILAGLEANSGEEAKVVSSSTALVSGLAASAHF